MPMGVDVQSQVSIPLSVRLRFGHAAVQAPADEMGVDLLHIKGTTVDPTLRPVERTGTDVDVLERPAQVGRLDRALRQRALDPLQHVRVRFAVRPCGDIP